MNLSRMLQARADAGNPITWDDVECDPNDEAVRICQEMETMFDFV